MTQFLLWRVQKLHALRVKALEAGLQHQEHARQVWAQAEQPAAKLLLLIPEHLQQPR